MSKQDRLDGFYWHLNSKMNTRSYATLKNPFIEGKFFGPDLNTSTALLASQKRSKRQPLNNQQNLIGENGLKSSNCAWITAILLGSSSTSAVLSYTKPAFFHSYWCCHPFFRVALPAVLPAPASATFFLSSTNFCTTETNHGCGCGCGQGHRGITKGATFWHYLTLIFHWWLTSIFLQWMVTTHLQSRNTR